MKTIDRDDIKDYVEIAAKAVAAAARCAPHTTGNLDLIINILTQDEITQIQEALVMPGPILKRHPDLRRHADHRRGRQPVGHRLGLWRVRFRHLQ